jgi:3-oxoacyl-[acyl-carrier-protein] synthase II
MIGHMLGGAGAMEAVATALQLREQFVHPTTNIANQDPQCDLDYLKEGGRPADINIGISNSF